MPFTRLCYFLFLALASLSAAQSISPNDYFVVPPPPGAPNDFTQNPTYTWGSPQTLQWRSEWTDINLKLYQNGNINFYIVTPDNLQVQGAQTYNYNSTFPQLDPTLPLVFFFRMNNVNNDSMTFSSHYFNLTNPPPATASSSVTPMAAPSVASSVTNLPTSSHATSTAMTMTSTSSVVPPASTPLMSKTVTPSANSETAVQTSPAQVTQLLSGQPNHPSGLSTGAAAGIGIGAGLGAIALIAGIVLLLWRRRKSSRAGGSTSNYGAAPGKYGTYPSSDNAEMKEHQSPPLRNPPVRPFAPPVEMHNTERGRWSTAQELP